MNAPVAFNTHAFVKKVAAAGMPLEQAEALVEALNEGVFESTPTKSDLKELELRLAAQIKEVELRIKEAELHLTVRMVAMIAATIAILGALVTLD